MRDSLCQCCSDFQHPIPATYLQGWHYSQKKNSYNIESKELDRGKNKNESHSILVFADLLKERAYSFPSTISFWVTPMHTLSYNFWLTKAAPDYFSSLIETQLDGQNQSPIADEIPSETSGKQICIYGTLTLLSEKGQGAQRLARTLRRAEAFLQGIFLPFHRALQLLIAGGSRIEAQLERKGSLKLNQGPSQKSFSALDLNSSPSLAQRQRRKQLQPSSLPCMQGGTVLVS